WRCKWEGCRKTYNRSTSLNSHVKKKHIKLDERSKRMPMTDSTALVQRRFRLDDNCLSRLQYIINMVQEEQAQVLGFSKTFTRYKASENAVLRFLQLFEQEVYPPLTELGLSR